MKTKEKQKKIIKDISLGIVKATRKYLDSIKDPLKQFSAFLYQGSYYPFIIELMIDYELQGFEKCQKHFEILSGIARKLTKQYWDEIERITQETKKEMWEEALKKAGGDKKKAIKIYGEV